MFDLLSRVHPDIILKWLVFYLKFSHVLVNQHSSTAHHIREQSNTVTETLDVDYDVALLTNMNKHVHNAVVLFDSLNVANIKHLFL